MVRGPSHSQKTQNADGHVTRGGPGDPEEERGRGPRGWCARYGARRFTAFTIPLSPPLTPGQRGMQVEASTQVSPAMSTNLRRTKQPTRLVVPVGNFWSRQQVPFLTLLDRHEIASDSLLLTVQRKRNTR